MRHAAKIIGLPFIVLFVAACGGGAETKDTPYFTASSSDWRFSAELACVKGKELPHSENLTRLAPISEMNVCGAERPYAMSASIDGRVRLSPPATLRCPMVAAVDQWIDSVVQPAAQDRFGERVVDMRVAASYACRPRNNQRGAKLSEHGYANAIDISEFVLSDGRTVTVTEGWQGSRKERKFLRDVHAGACGIFSTVIGPEGDKHHRTHIHMDLARHGGDGTYKYCK